MSEAMVKALHGPRPTRVGCGDGPRTKQALSLSAGLKGDTS
jgi:hypothetical protein